MTDKEGPWKIIESTEIYSNPRMRVFEDKVADPAGKESTYSIIQSPPAVRILAVSSENNIYLVNEFRYGVKRRTIEAIGGSIMPNERVRDAAKRVLREEAGIVAEDWRYLGYVDPYTSILNSPNYLYLAQNLDRDEMDPQKALKIQPLKMPFDLAYQLAVDGTITHAPTAVLLLKTKQYID